MKEGWTYKKFKDICYSISDGDWIESKDQSYSGIRLIQTGNIGVGKFIPKDDSRKYITEDTFKRLRCSEIFEGDVLISRLPNPLGRSCVLPKLDTRCITAVDCSIVRIKKDVIIPDYFIYYTQSQGYFSKIDSESSGTTRARITRKKLEQTEIPVPSLSEQQSIVNYLDSAFAKIDAMKANAEKALNEAKALFQASLKEMLEPKEGWEEKTLKDLTSKIGSGATPKGGRKVYIEKGCHLIRSMNVQYNEFKYDDLAHITDEAAEQLNGVEIQENDVLFNITGASIARCCVVPSDALPARVNQHVSILRLKQEVLPRFLSFIMNSPKHQKELLEIGEAGSTRQALTKTDLENHVICYPSLDNQTKLLCTLDSLKSKVDRLQENFDKISKECDALKQAILRQVFE